MRPEYELVTDIVRHGRLILDLIGPLDEADFVERFGEGITPFGAAISFALVALSEACRQLIGGGATGGPPRRRSSLLIRRSTGAAGSGSGTC